MGTLAVAVASLLALTACTGGPGDDVEVPTQVEAQLPAEMQQQLEASVTHAMGTIGASGAIVGVWAPWGGSWVAGLGTQTPGGAAVSSDLEFRIGQLTRPMTCDLLYSAAAEGLVELDAPVSQHVSGVADLSGVTLEQLCDSTSGLGQYSPALANVWAANPARVWNPRELASYGLGQPRAFAPGTGYAGADTNYVLLGLALERVTGQSAASLIQQRIAAPLGLTDTRLPSGKAAAPAESGALTGLLVRPGEGGAIDCAAPVDVSVSSSSIGFTDSGVVSNVEDLRRYVQALASGATTPAAFADDRFADAKPRWTDAPSWQNAAGGAQLTGSLVGYAGSAPGYSTAAYADSTTGLTVVVVLNNSVRGAGTAENLAHELAAIASKAPAAEGATAPESGLPWTAEQYHETIANDAVCAPPAG